jgi:hypothetical protein
MAMETGLVAGPVAGGGVQLAPPQVKRRAREREVVIRRCRIMGVVS